MKIAVIGAGAFGTALGGILAQHGYDVDYYDAKLGPERLSDVLNGAKVIVLAAPSAVAPFLLPYLPKTVPLIVATKGFLKTTYFDSFAHPMFISGPGFAKDIKAGKKACFTITDQMVANLLSADNLSFELTNDKIGLLLCGALKNVYALLAGLLNLQPGTKEHSQFLSDALSEMAAIVEANGGDKNTAKLACGKGDLKITCGAPSRNYEFGQMLRKNSKLLPQTTVEGVSALKKIKHGDIILPENIPLLKDLILKSDSWGF